MKQLMLGGQTQQVRKLTLQLRGRKPPRDWLCSFWFGCCDCGSQKWWASYIPVLLGIRRKVFMTCKVSLSILNPAGLVKPQAWWKSAIWADKQNQIPVVRKLSWQKNLLFRPLPELHIPSFPQFRPLGPFFWMLKFDLFFWQNQLLMLIMMVEIIIMMLIMVTLMIFLKKRMSQHIHLSWIDYELIMNWLW